jgi:hypothetical protein
MVPLHKSMVKGLYFTILKSLFIGTRLTVVHLGHPNHSVERTLLRIIRKNNSSEKSIPPWNLNRGPKARLNLTLDRAATPAGQENYS